MSFKIIFKDKVSAVRYKERVLSTIVEHGNITLCDVCLDVRMEFGEPGTEFLGWTDKHIPEIRKARIREIKDGFGLYLPDPVKIIPEPDLPVSNLATDKETAAKMTINPMELVFEMPIRDKEKIDYFIDRLFDMELRLALVEKTKVRVKSKARNGYEKIEYGYYIDSDENVITKKDGTIIKQKLWIIKMTDNTVREVKPKNVIFGWGNEEEE